MQNALGSSSIDIQWTYPLAVGDVDADGAQALLGMTSTGRARSQLGLTGAFAPATSVTTVADPLVPVLSAFLDTQAAVQTVLLLLFVSLIVVGAAVILLAAGMIAVRRADDLGLLRCPGRIGTASRDVDVAQHRDRGRPGRAGRARGWPWRWLVRRTCRRRWACRWPASRS